MADSKTSEHEAREYAESIINTLREPLIVLDQDLKVVTASQSFYGAFKVSAEGTEGQLKLTFLTSAGAPCFSTPWKFRESLEKSGLFFLP